jgi:tetratricopeptide (TPR) repeat protein
VHEPGSKEQQGSGSVSFSESIQAPCPKCDQRLDLNIWLIVGIAERPDLAERIRNGTLHDAPCPHCENVGRADAPLLLYRPDAEPCLLFSPAQNTTSDQDREQAAGLLQHLRDSLGDEWRDEWLAEGLPGVPRELLPAALSDDPDAALQAVMAETTEIRCSFEDEAEQALAGSLVAWIEQETLDEAEAYLCQHQVELLSDGAVRVMQLLVHANPRNPHLPDHQERLARAREMGTTAMYVEMRARRQREALQEALQHALAQAGPIGAAVSQFVQASEDEAAVLLQTETALLLTLDAGELLRQFMEAAEAVGDDELTARLVVCQEQWEAVYQTRAGGPLRSAADESRSSRQPQPEGWTERAEQQAVRVERGTQYTVISAYNCAVGDNALVINNVGRLPLCWQRPQEGRPRLARIAVGRDAELAELHGRLLAGQNAALVSRGTSAALRGQPAIGKTTLAAMYVDRYGDHYSGGILWLEVGPDRRSAATATPILQRVAAYAYAADVQAQALLENSVFAPAVVKSLLNGHGPLLVVVDDVWDSAVLRELQDGLPDGAFTLLTTRDYHVAFALEASDAAIQRLDVLSPADARLLLHRGAPGLPDALADRVAAGLGRHALALTLAAGALASRKLYRYERTAAELLQRVADGQGFGDLPRLDQAERLTPVEIAFKYSYDELGQGEHGAQRQAWFRALGALAQEADFDAAAAAALWELETPLADEVLFMLDGLGLIQETSASGFIGGRWQQHALLRAYAVSLQTTAERIHLPERHADHYIGLTQTCFDRKPRDYDRVEREFAQIQHAFAWCEEKSPRRAVRLALLLNDFMRNRGRVAMLNQWLRTALRGAEIHDNRLGKANTLKSLGDLERRLGNVAQARQHYDAALPLYEAEQARLGKANTLTSLGDLESRLGNVAQARQHYDAALPLYEAEQARLGKANTLTSLGDLERRLGNVAQARQHYDAALPLYEAEQARLGKANTLKSLGDLESRLGNVAQARQHYDAALPLYEAEQDPVGKMNTWISLAELEASLGRMPEAERYYQQVFDLAEQIGFANHPVVQGWREEYARLAGPQDVNQSVAATQEMAVLLIAWIQTPDWAQSEAYLQDQAAVLLTDDAESVLEVLQQYNPDGTAIPEHQALLQRCRQIGIAPAYQEFHAARTAAKQADQDPTALALSALLQADSLEALHAALAQHPALLELPTLEQMAALVRGAHEANQPEAAHHVLARLAVLLEQYNQAHAGQVDLAEQAAFATLHETLLPVAEVLDAGLAVGLRRSLGWALNTLGNAHAEQGDHATAVETYTRAIGHAPEEAMLYRNRAGEYIELQQWAQAEADVAHAVALQPDAPRLEELRQALAQQAGEH